MDAVEDGLFNIGIVPLQAAEQGLDLLPLGTAAPIVSNGAVFRKTAGALDKFQLIVSPPCDDIILMDNAGPGQFYCSSAPSPCCKDAPAHPAQR